MISQQAKQGIEHLFIKSAKANFAIHDYDQCEVVRLQDHMTLESTGKNILILTISSFYFKLLTIFHINEHPATSEYFGVNTTDKPFYDVFAEFGNLCCGSMNRDLSDYFPHLGMSTPYMLNSQCTSFLNGMNPEFLASYKILINQSVELRATLCMYAYGNIDFMVNTSSHEEETGELELF